jgi:hypothetical protein
MTPKVLDRPEAPASREAAEAPAPRPGRPTGALPASGAPTSPCGPWPLACVLPGLAGLAFFLALERLPLGLHDEAVLGTRDRLPVIARALASILGSSAVAWRLAGGAALALAGTAVALLVRSFSRTPAGPVVAGCLAATHCIVLTQAATVEGTILVLAAASAAMATVVCAGSLRNIAGTLALLALAGGLLVPLREGVASVPALTAWINRRADAGTASIAAAIACAATVCLGLAAGKRLRLASPAACVAALALATMGAGTFARDLTEAAPRRHEAARFLSALDAIPALAGPDAHEIVLDPPVTWFDLAAARAARHCTGFVCEMPSRGTVRIAQWGPPGEDGLMALQPPILRAVVEGTIDPAIALDSPADRAGLHARSPADEPEFRFTLPETPADLGRVRIIVVAGTEGRIRVIDRDLEDSIVQRVQSGDRTTLIWRPAWRPMACPDRELRWEDGEVCPRGSFFWWTVAVRDDHGTRLAPFRCALVVP